MFYSFFMENKFYTEPTQPDLSRLCRATCYGSLNIKFFNLLFSWSFTKIVCLAEPFYFDN